MTLAGPRSRNKVSTYDSFFGGLVGYVVLLAREMVLARAHVHRRRLSAFLYVCLCCTYSALSSNTSLLRPIFVVTSRYLGRSDLSAALFTMQDSIPLGPLGESSCVCCIDREY